MFITYENKKLYLNDIIIYTYKLILRVNGAVKHIQTVLCFSGKNSAIFKSKRYLVLCTQKSHCQNKYDSYMFYFIYKLDGNKMVKTMWSTNKDEVINMSYRYIH